MKDKTKTQLQPHSVSQLLGHAKVSLVGTCDIPATSEVEVMVVQPKGGLIPIRAINTNLITEPNQPASHSRMPDTREP